MATEKGNAYQEGRYGKGMKETPETEAKEGHSVAFLKKAIKIVKKSGKREHGKGY
jgi:hypothetical protein